MYGKNVLDTIVEKVSGGPNDDIAVLMLGYDKEMRDMLRKQNPGLSRRFNPENALLFLDYDDPTLANIVLSLCELDGLMIEFDVLRTIVNVLAQQRKLPNFGNAGAVRNLLTSIKARMIARLSSSEDLEETYISVSDVVGVERDEHGRTSGDALADLKSLYGMEAIISKLTDFQVLVNQNIRLGMPTSASNWLFLGNPGTGKTTTARKMKSMFENLGLVGPNSPMVETRASELFGVHVGEAEQLVVDAFESANGGVLFIDEAYELGQGPYGQSALSTLIGRTGNEQNTIVILAGYKVDMLAMLRKNRGGLGRFTSNTLEFPDWTASECTCFVLDAMSRGSFTADEGVKAALQRGFEDLITRPGWSNARDAISVWRDRILLAHARHTANISEVRRNITVSDVESGMSSYLSDRPKEETVSSAATSQWSGIITRMSGWINPCPM
jgi:hypothetical protein